MLNVICYAIISYYNCTCMLCLQIIHTQLSHSMLIIDATFLQFRYYMLLMLHIKAMQAFDAIKYLKCIVVMVLILHVLPKHATHIYWCCAVDFASICVN